MVCYTYGMFKQKPFPFSLIILVILVALYTVGSHYSWYWYYPWFDTLIHVISGLWIALVILWLASRLGQINSLIEYRAKSFLIAFVSAILFGVIWEILENLSQVTSIYSDGYSFDTAMDLLAGGFGGVLAYLYFIKRKKNIEKVVDVMPDIYNNVGIIKN
jgi:RsiW-degrading membrane proteinase PrsW (M82 family)